MSSRKSAPVIGRAPKDQAPGAKTQAATPARRKSEASSAESATTKAKARSVKGSASSSAVNGPSSTVNGPSSVVGRPPSLNKIVMPRRAQTYEQRISVPKMRPGSGRQKSLRVESKEPKKPRRVWRLPRVSLRLGALTPARVASLLLAATAVALLLFLFAADGFYVYTAEVQGNRLVSAHDIYTRSGIDGQNIFFIRIGEAERRIEDVPFVKAARLRLNLPAQVKIEVEERTPALVWQVGGNTYGIADDGTVIPANSATTGLPVIEAEGEPLKFGGKVNEQAVKVTLRVRALIPSAQKLVYSVERGIGVVTSQGWPVFFGMEDNEIAARVAVLNSLTDQFRERRIEPEFIDLRSSSRPYYRVKGAAR